jgi:peptidoglycan/LPS O-acetylase OafA/YrhL
MPANQKSRLGNFDTLRLVFAVLVILSHSYPVASNSYAKEPLVRLTGGQITFGDVGVWAFFVISGFLITQSWFRSPKPLNYLWRRIARIYPGFIVVTLIGAYVIVPLAADRATYHSISLPVLLVQTALLFGYSGPPIFVHNPFPNILNGSLWSIPFEFRCYIGVMVLGLMRVLRLRWLMVALDAAVIGFRLYLSITGWSPESKLFSFVFGTPTTWATVLPFFLAGMLFYSFGGAAMIRKPYLIFSAVVLVGSLFLPSGYIVTFPTCGAYLLFGLAYWPRLNPIHLGRYGDFSYGTYLYAFPVQQMIMMHAGGTMAPLTLFLIATPISIFLGALSWFLVERHFLARSSVLRHESVTVQSVQGA